MLASANVALRFFLELAALAAVFVIGNAVAPDPWKTIVGIASAVLFAVIWGLWLAPRARYPQRAPVRLVAGTVLLEIAAIGLALTAAPVAGLVLAFLILVNAIGLAVLPTPDWAAE